MQSKFMTKQLLLLCAIVGDVLGLDQVNFTGLTSLKVALTSNPTWLNPPRWCGGHNYIRRLKFGKANDALWPYAYFTAVSMYCHYDDYGNGETYSEEERYVEKMDGYNGYSDSYLECRIPLDYEEDGFRQVTFYGYSWEGGFGSVKATCNSRSDSHMNTSSSHPTWISLDAASAVAYPMVCPRKEVVIAIQAAFTSKGLLAVRTWCGSVIYHQYMPSIDYSYGDVIVVGPYQPGQMFDDTNVKLSTQDVMMCPDGAYMSGYTLVSAVNAEFYSMIMHCTDGSDLSATRLVPENKVMYVYGRNCDTNNKRLPMKYINVILDHGGTGYSMPALEIGCVTGKEVVEHYSGYKYGFSNPFIFRNLVCPAYHLAVGMIPIAERVFDGKGLIAIELVCKPAPECEFF